MLLNDCLWGFLCVPSTHCQIFGIIVETDAFQQIRSKGLRLDVGSIEFSGWFLSFLSGGRGVVGKGEVVVVDVVVVE